MNELLAIIIIVLVCCAMFFAWLISMATCLDRMVNLINGPTGNQQNSSSSSSSSVSKELILLSDNTQSTDVQVTKNMPKKKYSSAGFFQFGVAALGQKNRWHNSNKNHSNLKKLSIVPEQDEQVTNNSKYLPQEATIKEINSNFYEQSQKHIVFSYPELPLLACQKERCVEDVIDRRRQIIRQQREEETKAAANALFANFGTDSVHLASIGTEADTLLLLPTPYNDYFNLLRSGDGNLHNTGTDSMIPIVDYSTNNENKCSSLKSDNPSITNNRRNSNNCENSQIPKQIDLLIPASDLTAFPSINLLETGTKSEPGSIVHIPL